MNCMYHRLTKIEPFPDLILKGTFTDDNVRFYDVKSLLTRHEVFQDLVNIHHLFEQVHLDANGYGVSWNDNLDLDAEEIWVNGCEQH